jgi:hypothetical protein
MGSLSVATIARTVFTLGYLIALVVAGTPGWTAVLAGLSLVALWFAPVVLRVRRLARGRQGRAASTVLMTDDGVRAA